MNPALAAFERCGCQVITLTFICAELSTRGTYLGLELGSVALRPWNGYAKPISSLVLDHWSGGLGAVVGHVLNRAPLNGGEVCRVRLFFHIIPISVVCCSFNDSFWKLDRCVGQLNLSALHIRDTALCT